MNVIFIINLGRRRMMTKRTATWITASSRTPIKLKVNFEGIATYDNDDA